MQSIKIKGHKGTWYSLDSMMIGFDGKVQEVYLMERETYGEDADHIIINKDVDVIMEDVQNGFEDLKYCISERIAFGN